MGVNSCTVDKVCMVFMRLQFNNNFLTNQQKIIRQFGTNTYVLLYRFEVLKFIKAVNYNQRSSEEKQDN